MGKCSNCGKKIEYNQFKRYRGKILCKECYATRLERKRQKKEELERKSQTLVDNIKVDDSDEVKLKYELTDDEPKKETELPEEPKNEEL